MCNSSALWNILTEGNVRLDSQLAILKNMDDFLLYGVTLDDLEKKLEKFMEFAKSKNLKLNPKKFFISEQGCIEYFLSGIQSFSRRICLTKHAIVYIKKCNKKPL